MKNAMCKAAIFALIAVGLMLALSTKASYPMTTTRHIQRVKIKRLPTWVSEHIEMDRALAPLIRSTLYTMQNSGRARNVIEMHHSGKLFLQFERKSQLKFKKVRNEQ